MKSKSKSTQSSRTGFNMSGDHNAFIPKTTEERIRDCREGLTEWLLTFGMRWVSWQEIGDMVALGYPEREGYLERVPGDKLQKMSTYLHFRLTQKGLEFINEK